MDRPNEQYTFIKKDDPGFPEILKRYAFMPEYLYFKGSLPDPYTPAIAIVGARSCSTYGRSQAESLARVLAENGVQVISGLAFGIDSCAHEGALAGGGKTFAVMGCGIDLCYPASNRRLYGRILETGGGILSEYPPGAPALAYHFPIRNRIISALSDAVIVCEAKQRSGSLITANYALEQGKTIYALPGRVSDRLSTGCNDLIRQGAFPLLSAEQVLEDLGIEKRMKKEEQPRDIREGLDPDEIRLMKCLSDDPKTLGEICSESGLSHSVLACLIVKLEMKGLINEPLAGSYCRGH